MSDERKIRERITIIREFTTRVPTLTQAARDLADDVELLLQERDDYNARLDKAERDWSADVEARERFKLRALEAEQKLVQAERDAGQAIADMQRYIKRATLAEKQVENERVTLQDVSRRRRYADHLLFAVLEHGWPSGTTGPACVREARLWIREGIKSEAFKAWMAERGYGLPSDRSEGRGELNPIPAEDMAKHRQEQVQITVDGVDTRENVAELLHRMADGIVDLRRWDPASAPYLWSACQFSEGKTVMATVNGKPGAFDPIWQERGLGAGRVDITPADAIARIRRAAHRRDGVEAQLSIRVSEDGYRVTYERVYANGSKSDPLTARAPTLRALAESVEAQEATRNAEEAETMAALPEDVAHLDGVQVRGIEPVTWRMRGDS